MISALRKIEGRGELEGATSAVMEMCVDNPREGFADLFATHPPIESRIAAIIQFAGGHDPGLLALPGSFGREESDAAADDPDRLAPTEGRPGETGGAKPFLPARPPIELGGESSSGGGEPGPWGPHRRS